MPGGIGPISESTMSACAQRDRVVAPVANANEIFFNLDGRRVCYDESQSFLYFVATPDDLIGRVILHALAGMRRPVAIEQMYLDANHFFPAARRVGLTRQQADTVLIALRLAGVRAMLC